MAERAASDVRRTGSETRPDRSENRRNWGPGWIWALPVAAVLVVGWWIGRELLSGGESITIVFDDVHGLKKKNSKIMLRGLEVGQVKELQLAKDGHGVTVTAEIKDEAQNFLRSGTQFWLRGATPDFSDPSSFGAILAGPTLVMEPGPGDKTDHFTGRLRKPVVTGAHDPPQDYVVALPGAVGGLSPGEPVKMLGYTVGEVKEIGFRYDAQSGRIGTPVTLALYPSLFRIDGADAAQRNAALKLEIGALVQHGLKARLDRTPPVIGSPEVTLEMTPDNPETLSASAGGTPEIPAAPGGGLDSIVARVNAIPVDQIAANLLSITQHIDSDVSSPALKDAIVQLDGTLKELHQTIHTAGPRIDDLTDRLRNAAGQIEKAAAAAQNTAKSAQQTAEQADKLLGGTPNQNGIGQATREIAAAARSVRELANYLDRHPEALVQGRSGK